MRNVKPTSMLWSALALSLSVCGFVATEVRAEGERAHIGDVRNGEKLYKKASRKKVRVAGDWINRYSDQQVIKGLKLGKGGFPKVKSDNVLDFYDVAAFIRSRNTNLSDIAGPATHVLAGKGTYDKYALERLKEQAKIVPGKKEKTHRVFALFSVGGERDADDDLTIVRPKENKKRDKLKAKAGTGYVVFMPLKGLRGGGYEVAFAVDRDIKITDAVIRAPDGSIPEDLNRIAARLKGRGGRGDYGRLKAGGGGRAAKELDKPLSDAWLLGMEAVYMYEVEERDYFAFDE